MSINTAVAQPLPNIFAQVGEKTMARPKGSWEFDLASHKLYWSDEQFKIYGYKPGEFSPDDNYFIAHTTHASEIKRITCIIDEALKNQSGYLFRRRIIRKNNSIGFVETQANIVRSTSGDACKIIGTTIDLFAEPAKGIYEYNDPRFFNSLYKDYRAAIVRTIYKLVPDAELANDLCQEVFVKAWHSMSSYDSNKGCLYTWLANIAKNHSLDFLRSKQCRHSKLTGTLSSSLSERTADDVPFEGRLYVRDLVLQLPLAMRELIELLFIQGFSQAEVAQMKSIPLGTIKSKSRAAIIKLRELVAAAK